MNSDDVALSDTRASEAAIALPPLPVLEVGSMFRGLKVRGLLGAGALFEAERRGHRSVTFPALGTGVGGVPHGLSARLVLEAIRTFASFAPRHTRSIRIALPTPETLAQWKTGLVALDVDAAHR